MRMHFILAPVLLAAVPAFALQIGDGQYAKTYNDRDMDSAQIKYNRIKAKMNSGVPVGTIIPWPTSGFPDGGSDSWLECNGQAVDPVIYPELYVIMHTVPDMRGRFLRAADNGKGIDSGRQVGTYQEENVGKYDITGMKSKEITITTSTGEHDDVVYQNFEYLTTTPTGRGVNLQGGNPAGGDTHPANFAVRYIIRAQ